MSNGFDADPTALDAVIIINEPSDLDIMLANRHNLPIGTRFYGDVGTGFLNYNSEDETTKQVFDKDFYVPPEERTGDQPIDIQDWDPNKKRKKNDDETETSSREQGEDPKTIANAGARAFTDQAVSVDEENPYARKVGESLENYSKRMTDFYWKLRSEYRQLTEYGPIDNPEYFNKLNKLSRTFNENLDDPSKYYQYRQGLIEEAWSNPEKYGNSASDDFFKDYVGDPDNFIEKYSHFRMRWAAESGVWMANDGNVYYGKREYDHFFKPDDIYDASLTDTKKLLLNIEADYSDAIEHTMLVNAGSDDPEIRSKAYKELWHLAMLATATGASTTGIGLGAGIRPSSPTIKPTNSSIPSSSPAVKPASSSPAVNPASSSAAPSSPTVKPASSSPTVKPASSSTTVKPRGSSKEKTTPNNQDTVKGDPVVVTRGEYIETWDDFYIEATIPLHATRYYGNQFNIVGGPLGRNRISPFDVVFRVTARNTLEYFDEQGNCIGFDRPHGIASVGNAAFPTYRLSAPQLRHLRLRDRRVEKHFRQYKDSLYRLEKIEDLNGNSVNFIRDKQGLLLEVQHSDGFSLKFENDEVGQRTSVKWLVDGGEAHLVTYHYDNFGNMLKADCQNSFCITYTYDEKNRLNSWNDNTGRSKTVFTYDDEDRVIHTETTGPWNNDIFEYDRENRVSTYRPGGGEIFERFWYDENENILKEQTPIGAIKYFEYDEAGFKTSQQDEAGNTSKWQYDNAGNIINFTDAEGRWAHYAWNDFGSPNVVVDGEGNSWKYDHDGAGNVISIIDAEGYETRIEWTQAGQPSIIHFADGGKEQRFYDQHHRLIEIILANGGKVRLERDIFGRVISEQSPDGSLTRIFYDHSKGKEFYQPTRIERPDGSIIERKFDAEGQVSYVKDAQGRQWIYNHGPFDLLLGLQEPGGGQLSFEYDVLKRLTCVKDALQRQWHLERDAAGRIIHECDFAGQNFYYHYDDVGNVIKRINADNSFIEYSYDKTGLLLLEKAFSAQGDLQETTSFDYDGRQLLKRAENGSSVIAITRDKNGRIIQEGCNGRKITSQFDAMGRRISYQIGQSLTKFYHDPLGSLTQMVIGNHKPMDFQYDIMGRETQRQSHSGFSLNQRYDALGLLTSQEAGFALSTLGRGLEGARAAQLRGFDAVKAAAQVKRDYSWNKAFEPLSIKDQRWGETNYSYDDNGQMTKASSSDGRVEQFNYDPARNITGFSDENNILSHWQQAKGGRITDAKGANGEHIALEYDECNRIIKRIVTRNGFRPKIWHYQWDAKDRLIGCTTPTGERWTYHYDPFGRRIFKINASIAQKALLAQSPEITEIEKTRGAYHEDNHQRSSGELSNDTIVGTAYLWDGDTIAEEAPLKASGEADWNNATKWHYEPDTFLPLAKETADGELFYIVNDHLGTPREMFSEDGKLVWAAQYRTWGAVHKVWQADNDNDIRGPYPPPIRGNLAFKYDTLEAEAAQTCPIRFQGQWEDAENGLYYNRYRYYDPLTAQYISPDPIGLEGGLRSNSYVDNPNAWIDPCGLAGNPATATHVTYVGTDVATGKPYIGYASMQGHRTAEQVIKYRYSGNFSRFGGEPPQAIYHGYGWEGKQIARGLEQIEFENNGGLKGTANKRNPVGKKNKNRAAYLSKAQQYQSNQAQANTRAKATKSG